MAESPLTTQQVFDKVGAHADDGFLESIGNHLDTTTVKGAKANPFVEWLIGTLLVPIYVGSLNPPSRGVAWTFQGK